MGICDGLIELTVLNYLLSENVMVAVFLALEMN